MSCNVLEYTSIAALADFVTALCEHGFNYFGFDAPNTLKVAFIDCKGYKNKAFEKLARYNHLAYDSRYNGASETSTIPDMPTINAPYHPRNFETVEANGVKFQRTILEPWHYQLYKTLQCYIYNINEDATHNTTLYRGLEQLEIEMAKFIVSHQPEYINAEWG